MWSTGSCIRVIGCFPVVSVPYLRARVSSVYGMSVCVRLAVCVCVFVIFFLSVNGLVVLSGECSI